jgi:uncharacterized protein YfiM (DUF2279 family)
MTSAHGAHNTFLLGLGSVLIFSFLLASAGCTASQVGAAPSASTAGILSANTSSLAFGSVQLGATKNMSLVLSNTGPQGSSLQISQLAVSGSGFNASGTTMPVALSAGQQVTLTISFAPTASGSASGSVAILSDATNSSVTVSLTGSGISSGQLTANPASIAFGNVQVGGTATSSVTLKNSATQGSIQISQVTTSGSGFSTSGITLPLTLNAEQSASLTVRYAPAATGSNTGSIAVVSDASNPNLSVPLSGTGTTAAAGQLAVSPATLSFGTVNVGSSKNMTGTLTASSSGVTVSSASWNGTGFSVSNISFPLSLAAGQTASFTVTFAPQTSGTSTGSVSFLSNASNSPSVEQWSGAGAQQTAHSVDLSWNPSAAGSVQGYYVYRGGQSGGPYSRISVLQSATAYVDANVLSGQTYYYVVTALGTNSVESGYSNEVPAAIP